MARLFTYGKLKRINTISNLLLPGEFATAFGVKYAQPALVTDGNAIEFGETVLVTGVNDRSATITRATSSITNANAAFVLREVTGQRVVAPGIIEGIAAGVKLPVTIVKADSQHTWSIVVPVAEDVAAGNPVYVGKGSGSTVAGALYKEAKGNGGADTVLLTNWKFQTASYQPTTGAGKCAVITNG